MRLPVHQNRCFPGRRAHEPASYGVSTSRSNYAPVRCARLKAKSFTKQRVRALCTRCPLKTARSWDLHSVNLASQTGF